MLNFLGLHHTMCSDCPIFAFMTGLGNNMKAHSPGPDEVSAGEGGHVPMEPRLQSTSNFSHAAATEGRLEELQSSPSLFVLPPIQLSGDGFLISEAESTIPSVPETSERGSHITALPDKAPGFQPRLSENAGGPLEEDLLTVHPQLASIPEMTENDAEETRGIMSLPESSSAPIQAPETFSAVGYTAESAAWIPPATSIPTEPPTQTQTAPQSFIETQYTPTFVEPTSPYLPSYPGDTGDTGDAEDASSAASTNGDASSVFDDYYSDTSSYTASLLSDVKNYAYENGRRYHSYREGHYVLPNDEQEQDRQDLLHHVRNLVLNGALFRAPVGKHLQRVLDIGTGTGIWAIDFADSFPSAEVIGTDLSPIQPSWVPPNLQFLVDDAESAWLYSANRPFDFIHARDLGGAIANWPRLLRQAYEHLRPGGWIELQEFEVTLRSDDESLRLAPTLCEFLGRLHEASEAFHRPMNIAEGHRQRLIEAGFEDVRDEVYKVRPFPLSDLPCSGYLWGLVALSFLFFSELITKFHRFRQVVGPGTLYKNRSVGIICVPF